MWDYNIKNIIIIYSSNKLAKFPSIIVYSARMELETPLQAQLNTWGSKFRRRSSIHCPWKKNMGIYV